LENAELKTEGLLPDSQLPPLAMQWSPKLVLYCHDLPDAMSSSLCLLVGICVFQSCQPTPSSSSFFDPMAEIDDHPTAGCLQNPVPS